MAHPRIRAALDLTCAFDQPRTGVAYAAINQASALARLSPTADLRLFATRSGSAAESVPEFTGLFAKKTVLPRMGALKRHCWSRFNQPPIEWFTGPCDIAHGFFHLLPAARRAKRVVTVHDLSFIRHPEWHTDETVRVHTELVQHAVRHADAIVTVSETVRLEMLDILDAEPSQIFTVPNGIDPAEFDGPMDADAFAALVQRLGISNAPYLIYIGTIEPRKNLENLVHGYRHARKHTDPELKLLLVGKMGWRTETIEDIIAQDDGVIHAGHLPRTDMITLLKGAAACVYPSIYEGFGLPVLEALAAGTPVVTSKIPVFCEVAGDAALFVSPVDPPAMGDAMSRTITDESLRARLIEKGLARAGQLTWEASARKLFEVYQGVLQQ